MQLLKSFFVKYNEEIEGFWYLFKNESSVVFKCTGGTIVINSLIIIVHSKVTKLRFLSRTELILRFGYFLLILIGLHFCKIQKLYMFSGIHHEVY